MTPPPLRSAASAVVAAEPLFAREASEAGLASLRERPGAVYMGIGLCTRHRMAEGLPVDVLGMLLPAERLRAATGAEQLVVLIADAHARASGFDPSEVATRANCVERALLRVKVARGLDRLVLIRASALHADPGYQAALGRVERRAGDEGNTYMHRQTADVAYLDEALGGILKLGWTVDVDGVGGGYRDEVAFDRLVESWSGRRPAFAYVRCGRALDDRRPKVSPYVGVDRGRRIYLHPGESVRDKLTHGPHIASRRNVAAVRSHLELIADTWGVQGTSLEARVEAVLSELYPGRDGGKVARPRFESRPRVAHENP